MSIHLRGDPRVYTVLLRARSMRESKHLKANEFENAGKVILPSLVLQELSHHLVTYPMVFSFSYGDRITHGGVADFDQCPGNVYFPSWMMDQLGITSGDNVVVRNVNLPLGNFVRLQPLTEDFLQIHNHRATLEHGLVQYGALTKGDVITIPYGDDRVYRLRVLDTKPAPAIAITETDLEVDFAPPADVEARERAEAERREAEAARQERERQALEAARLAAATAEARRVNFVPFSGSGTRVRSGTAGPSGSRSGHDPALEAILAEAAAQKPVVRPFLHGVNPAAVVPLDLGPVGAIVIGSPQRLADPEQLKAASQGLLSSGASSSDTALPGGAPIFSGTSATLKKKKRSKKAKSSVDAP
ncbi:hypothetical protein H696_03781 [Fonticula alba]|uniref:Ubiquitin fusion degradation protein 1 n=1 Tax=Fonticula alba TaxID=691883 RepID=A0A058Z4Y6_FONAL|nr:hypothetical protein H696_03781 [Fonticula alba]KCV69349.1 hypothetical protein H696_03781 [Fonticula alba]|eukprot:XP_009495914.1 hypothetical protein H696_03781 [Fonticula alba]